jgi:hypothetical protein
VVGGGAGAQRTEARSLEEEDVVFFVQREGIRVGVEDPCVGLGWALDRELSEEPSPGRCVLFIIHHPLVIGTCFVCVCVSFVRFTILLGPLLQ